MGKHGLYFYAGRKCALDSLCIKGYYILLDGSNVLLCLFIKHARTFQTQSIAVSVQTLCAIAVERYFAICCPLKDRFSRRTLIVAVAAIWLISSLVAVPSVLYMQLVNTFYDSALRSYLTYCVMSLGDVWGSVYKIVLIVGLYVLPMLIITIFYSVISCYLWKVQPPGVVLNRKSECLSSTKVAVNNITAYIAYNNTKSSHYKKNTMDVVMTVPI